jgi:hypothetical protein
LVSYDANWNEVGPHINLGFAGTGNWTGVAFNYKPPPGSTRVVVEATTSTTGTFWFDDVALTPTTNLLINGSFETGDVGWNLSSQASIDTTPAAAHSGNNSLRLVANSPWQQSWQVVAVSSSQTYSFTGWGRSTSAGGDFALVSYDANWNEVGPHINLGFAGTGTWVAVTAAYQPPPGATQVVVEATTAGVGTFWYDDVTLW